MSLTIPAGKMRVISLVTVAGKLQDHEERAVVYLSDGRPYWVAHTRDEDTCKARVLGKAQHNGRYDDMRLECACQPTYDEDSEETQTRRVGPIVALPMGVALTPEEWAALPAFPGLFTAIGHVTRAHYERDDHGACSGAEPCERPPRQASQHRVLVMGMERSPQAWVVPTDDGGRVVGRVLR